MRTAEYAYSLFSNAEGIQQKNKAVNIIAYLVTLYVTTKQNPPSYIFA